MGNDYPEEMKELIDSSVKSDSWVHSITGSEDPAVIADLIYLRLTKPEENGPPVETNGHPLSDFGNGEGDVPASIIVGLVSYSVIDYDVFNKAVSILMKKIVSGEIKEDYPLMEGMVCLMDSLSTTEASQDLYAWLVKNESMMKSENKLDEELYLAAVVAYTTCQRKEDNCLDFWKKMWVSDIRSLREVSYHGIKDCDISVLLDMLPTLAKEKDDRIPMIFRSLWHIIDPKQKEEVSDLLREAFKRNDQWVGVAINDSLFGESLFNKKRVLQKLHDMMA